ncbi:hypothetical protein V6Z11_A11G243000 [Gossypium hirsutum]
MEDFLAKEETTNLEGKNRRVGKVSHLLSAAAEASRPVAMKILSWNVRRLGNPQTIRRLRHVLKLHNPQIVLFMKTKICKSRMERVRKSYGFLHGIDVNSNGSGGGLCLAWRGGNSIQLRSFSQRHIGVIIEKVEKGSKWRFTRYYGSPYSQDRDNAWNLLHHLGDFKELLWIVCGEFNEILYGFEKKWRFTSRRKKNESFSQGIGGLQSGGCKLYGQLVYVGTG